MNSYPRAWLYLTPPPLQQLASLLNAELNSMTSWALTDILVECFHSAPYSFIHSTNMGYHNFAVVILF